MSFTPEEREKELKLTEKSRTAFEEVYQEAMRTKEYNRRFFEVIEILHCTEGQTDREFTLTLRQSGPVGWSDELLMICEDCYKTSIQKLPIGILDFGFHHICSVSLADAAIGKWYAHDLGDKDKTIHDVFKTIGRFRRWPMEIHDRFIEKIKNSDLTEKDIKKIELLLEPSEDDENVSINRIRIGLELLPCLHANEDVKISYGFVLREARKKI